MPSASTLSTMVDFLEGKTVEEMTCYQRHRRYYELSIYFSVVLQTL